MTERAFKENLSDMELKRSIYTCNIDKKRKYTYKYVEKQKMNSSKKKINNLVDSYFIHYR